jgi:hypothetical protein
VCVCVCVCVCSHYLTRYNEVLISWFRPDGVKSRCREQAEKEESSGHFVFVWSSCPKRCEFHSEQLRILNEHHKSAKHGYHIAITLITPSLSTGQSLLYFPPGASETANFTNFTK